VGEAVEKLNKGQLRCQDGCCVVYSSSCCAYYLLFRDCNKEVALARLGFPSSVGSGATWATSAEAAGDPAEPEAEPSHAEEMPAMGRTTLAAEASAEPSAGVVHAAHRLISWIRGEA